jgi:regulatory protein
MRRRRAPSDPPADTSSTAIRAAALRLLGRRDYTRTELRSKLTTRGYPGDVVNDVLTQLAADRLVDDRRAADAHVRTASRVKGRGRQRIARELTARGVDAEVAAQALGQISPDDERAALRRVLARTPLPSHPTPAERRRVFQRLVRRGFSIDLVVKMLRYGADPDRED